MFANIFNLIFGVIDITEPEVDPEDTALYFIDAAEYELPALNTHPINPAILIDTNALIGCLAAYRMTTADDWQTGHIRAVQETRFGMKVLFAPEDKRLPEKWRFVNEVYYAWYE